MSLAKPGILKEEIIYYNCLIDLLYAMEGSLKAAKTAHLRMLIDKVLAMSLLQGDFLTQEKMLAAQQLQDHERTALLREIKTCQKTAIASATAALEARHHDYIYMEAV